MQLRHDASAARARLDTVRIVHVEDCADDAELVSLELRAAGFALDYRRIDDESGLMAALRGFDPHLVLSDVNLPGFCGGRALELVRAHAPGLPFVFFTGSTSSTIPGVGEHLSPDAVALKDDLSDLPLLLRRILAGVGTAD